MKSVLSERTIWLAKHILPHEAALRAWLQTRRLAGLDVDDIIQETYARLVATQSVDHIQNPKTYLFQVALSVVASYVRHAKVIPITTVSDLEILGLPSGEPSPEQQVADQEELVCVAEAIAALPPKTREVIKLRRIDGLSQKEVAEKLGLAESTVEKHMARGFLILQNLFKRGGKSHSAASIEAQKDIDQDHVERNRPGN